MPTNRSGRAEQQLLDDRIEPFLQQLRAAGYAERTLRRRRTVLRAFARCVGGGEKWGHFGGLEGATCVVAQWTLGRHQKSCIPVWVALRQLWLPLGNRALLPAGRRCSL